LVKESNIAQKGYEPNYVCLPFTDMRIEMEIDIDLNEVHII
jgi:hypothetical protein